MQGKIESMQGQIKMNIEKLSSLGGGHFDSHLD